MRITKVSVKGLFGMFDHEIPLNQESRITIIHGPNGVGKTVLMRMLHGLFNYEYEFVGRVPFQRLSIFFDDNGIIHVKVLESGSLPTKYHEIGVTAKQVDRLLIEYTSETGKPASTPFVPRRSIGWFEFYEAMREENVTGLVPIIFASDDSLWYDYEVQDVLATGNILDTYPEVRNRLYGDIPGWFRRIRRKGCTTLIQTQRLQHFTVRSDEPLDPSLKDPSDVVRLESVPKEFHYRIFEHFSGGAKPEQYVLFEEIVNERLLFKYVTTDVFADSELTVVSQNGSMVPLENLSSGEQHLLVLYYQLLFEIEPDTLVLIDEPELSLNVVWQRNFLKDLQRIVELRKFDVLIATHSPQIIHDKWDWVVHLDEKVDD